jgi:asparagine synthase (glutamine-hydrolysing)
MVAERFETHHTELVVTEATPELIDDIVWHYDQPFGDSSAIPTFQVARITRPHVTVVLTGDGGDESFAGYHRYRLAAYRRCFQVPRPLRSLAAASLFPLSGVKRRRWAVSSLLAPDLVTAYFSTLSHLQADQRAQLYTAEMMAELGPPSYPPLELMRSRSRPSVLDTFLEADVNNYLPDDLLVKMDVATMAHSLEARSPLLDHRLMEFMASVPSSYKLRRGQSKYILKAALRGFLPDAVLDRRKMGFGVPLGHWLRTSLREQLLDTLLSSRFRCRGYFNPDVVRRMIAVHQSGDDTYQYVLWDLFMLEKWHHQYVDMQPLARLPILALR